MGGRSWALARRSRKRPRRRRWLLLIVLVLGSLFVAEVGLTPWDLHIGGRFTPALTWDGYGMVQASNGGRYLLFTHMPGGLVRSAPGFACGSFSGYDTLRGSARPDRRHAPGRCSPGPARRWPPGRAV